MKLLLCCVIFGLFLSTFLFPIKSEDRGIPVKINCYNSKTNSVVSCESALGCDPHGLGCASVAPDHSVYLNLASDEHERPLPTIFERLSAYSVNPALLRKERNIYVETAIDLKLQQDYDHAFKACHNYIFEVCNLKNMTSHEAYDCLRENSRDLIILDCLSTADSMVHIHSKKDHSDVEKHVKSFRRFYKSIFHSDDESFVEHDQEVHDHLVNLVKNTVDSVNQEHALNFDAELDSINDDSEFTKNYKYKIYFRYYKDYNRLNDLSMYPDSFSYFDSKNEVSKVLRPIRVGSCGCYNYSAEVTAISHFRMISTKSTTYSSLTEIAGCLSELNIQSSPCRPLSKKVPSGYNVRSSQGRLGSAFIYAKEHGLVTGGEYGDHGKTVGCVPNFIPNCNQSLYKSTEICKLLAEDPSEVRVACPTSCTTGSIDFTTDHFRIPSYPVYHYEPDEELFANTMNYLNVVIVLILYEDFFHFVPTEKVDVYQHLYGDIVMVTELPVVGFGYSSVSKLAYVEVLVDLPTGATRVRVARSFIYDKDLGVINFVSYTGIFGTFLPS